MRCEKGESIILHHGIAFIYTVAKVYTHELYSLISIDSVQTCVFNKDSEIWKLHFCNVAVPLFIVVFIWNCVVWVDNFWSLIDNSAIKLFSRSNRTQYLGWRNIFSRAIWASEFSLQRCLEMWVKILIIFSCRILWIKFSMRFFNVLTLNSPAGGSVGFV